MILTRYAVPPLPFRLRCWSARNVADAVVAAELDVGAGKLRTHVRGVVRAHGKAVSPVRAGARRQEGHGTDILESHVFLH